MTLFKHTLILLLMMFNIPFAIASSVDVTVGGSNGPVTVSVGDTVSFDATVICDDDLAYVPGSGGPKDGDDEGEVEWQIVNNSADTIRINGFGVSWNCINDPSNLCETWRFDYLKFDSPITNAQKIYDSLTPVDNNNSFPVTTFDGNVGTGIYQNPYLDITAGQTININEIEFVEQGNNSKVKNIPAGTQVEFTVTFRNIDGVTDYVQVFTVTW